MLEKKVQEYMLSVQGLFISFAKTASVESILKMPHISGSSTHLQASSLVHLVSSFPLRSTPSKASKKSPDTFTCVFPPGPQNDTNPNNSLSHHSSNSLGSPPPWLNRLPENLSHKSFVHPTIPCSPEPRSLINSLIPCGPLGIIW